MKIQIPSNFKQIELTITYINTLLKFQEIPKKIILQDSYFNEIPTTFIVSFVWQTLFSIKLLTITLGLKPTIISNKFLHLIHGVPFERRHSMHRLHAIGWSHWNVSHRVDAFPRARREFIFTEYICSAREPRGRTGWEWNRGCASNGLYQLVVSWTLEFWRLREGLKNGIHRMALEMIIAGTVIAISTGSSVAGPIQSEPDRNPRRRLSRSF